MFFRPGGCSRDCPTLRRRFGDVDPKREVTSFLRGPSPDVTLPGRMTGASSSCVNSESRSSRRRASAPGSRDSWPPWPACPWRRDVEHRGLPRAPHRPAAAEGAVTPNSERPPVWCRSLRAAHAPTQRLPPPSALRASHVEGGRAAPWGALAVRARPPPRAAPNPGLVLLKSCFASAHVNLSSVAVLTPGPAALLRLGAPGSVVTAPFHFQCARLSHVIA